MKVLMLLCVIITAWLGVWTQRTAGQGPRAEVVTAAVGQTATLTAPVSTRVLSFAWYRGAAVVDAQRILSYVVSTSVQTNGPRYTGRETPLPDGSLRIRDLTTSYSGDYTVTVTDSNGTPTTATRRLRVYDSISNVTISRNVTSGHLWEHEGSVNLTCSALGTDPIFSWTFNGSALPQDPRYNLSPDNSSLVISPVTRRDTGPFVCTASNPANTQSSKPYLLTISYRISNVTISSNVTSGHLWENEGSVNLTCSALGTDPVFSWTFNGSALPQDPRDGSSLVISPVTRGDAGSFVCTASNPANNQSSQPFLLKISLRPSGGIQCGAQSINDSLVELSCSWLGGSPPSDVQLQLPPSINANASHEVNHNVPRSDITPNMTLTCRGEQEGYTDSCSLALELPQDSGFKDNTTLPVTGGQPVVLVVNLLRRSSSRVSSAGVLPATFTWFNGTSSVGSGGRVEITSNASFSQMVIASAMESDSGDYVCQAENLMGATRFSFRVHVSPAPETPTTPGGLSAGAIAGIVVGVLAVVVIIGVTVYCVVKKKKDKKLRTSNRNQPGDPNVLQMKDTPKQDEVNYAVLKLNNNNSQIPPPDYPNAETLYAQVRKK